MPDRSLQSFFRRWGRSLAVGAVLAALVVWWPRGASGVAAAQGQDPERAAPVVLEAVVLADVPMPAEAYSGRVEAVRQGPVSFQVPGLVAELLVEAGDDVAAGQLLARVDGERLEATLRAVDSQLAAARARLAELVAGPRVEAIARARSAVTAARRRAELARSTADRFRVALAEQAVSPQDEEAARRESEVAAAALQQAQAQLDELEAGTRTEQLDAQRAAVGQLEAEQLRLRRDVRDLEVRAPYAARVQRRMVERGAVVAAGAAAFQLVGTDELRVRVGLPAARSGNLPAAVLEVIADGRALPLARERIVTLPRVDPRVRTVDVLLPLAAGALARDGALATVRLSGALRRGVVVPQAALRAAPRGLFRCLVAEPAPDGSLRAANRDVLVDALVGDRVLVRGGLQDGEQLIVSGADHILRGMVVRPVERAEEGR